MPVLSLEDPMKRREFISLLGGAGFVAARCACTAVYDADNRLFEFAISR